MKTKYTYLLILFILLLQTGCVYAMRYDGPYRGKVVDEHTREPIEGVVVLGTWGVYHYGLGGGFTTFYDAREAATDKNGEFIIPGQGLRILSSVGYMGALIYKAGYTYYQTGSWNTLKTGLYSSKEIKWEADVPIFYLRKLTEEERKNDIKSIYIPNRGSVPCVQMTREVNIERIFRGWEPL